VEALAAKTDVKGRAQRRAAEVTGKLSGKARTVKDKVTEQAGELRDEAAAKASQAKDTAQAKASQAKDTAKTKTAEVPDTAQVSSAPMRQQVAARAAEAARAVGNVTPAPVQRSAGRAADAVRTHPGMVAAVAGALILAWLAIRRLRC
jgi:hypothetical protein